MAKVDGLQDLLDKIAELPDQKRNDFYLVHGNEIARMKEYDRTGKDPESDETYAHTGHPALGLSCIQAENDEAERQRQGKHYEIGDWRTDAKTQDELDRDIMVRASSRYTGSYNKFRDAGQALLAEKGDQFDFSHDAGREAFVDAVAARAGAKAKPGTAPRVEPQEPVDTGPTQDDDNRAWMRELGDFRGEAGLR